MEKSVDIKLKNKIVPAKLVYSDTPPWSVNLCVGDDEYIKSDGDDLFDALINLRKEMDSKGGVILCHGARRDVHPSAMSRSMGAGVMAYQLALGKPARRADMVNIFDRCDDDSQIVSPEDQEVFYKAWLESLKS